MQVIPETQAFARDITRLLPDRTKVYGGPIILGRISYFPATIRKVSGSLVPLMQKTEDPTVQLLKQILASSKQKNKDLGHQKFSR